jgi:hypothetical protein
MIDKAPSTSNPFGGATLFKVQVNFDMPLFEGQIDVDALEKWLNLLEGYSYFENFSDIENITFTLIKSLTMSNIGGNVNGRDIMNMSQWNLRKDL